MKDLWSRLEAWAVSNAGRSLGLRAGASEQAIAAAEKTIGMTFPPDVRASLLAHDGQEGQIGDVFEWLPGCSPLKSLAQIVERWKEEQGMAEEFPEGEPQPEGPLHTVLWHAKRIPIAGNEWWDGDNTYIDFHPSAAGTPGQIIMFVSECDLVCLGRSFADAIETYLAALQSGDWVWSKDKGHVTPKSEPAKEYPHESYEFSKYVEKLGAPAAKPAKKAAKPAKKAAKSAKKPAKPAAAKKKAKAAPVKKKTKAAPPKKKAKPKKR
jgi:cell wall assembly regulator SMI1